jgi:hypothetical protein
MLLSQNGQTRRIRNQKKPFPPVDGAAGEFLDILGEGGEVVVRPHLERVTRHNFLLLFPRVASVWGHCPHNTEEATLLYKSRNHLSLHSK